MRCCTSIFLPLQRWSQVGVKDVSFVGCHMKLCSHSNECEQGYQNLDWILLAGQKVVHCEAKCQTSASQ